MNETTRWPRWRTLARAALLVLALSPLAALGSDYRERDCGDDGRGDGRGRPLFAVVRADGTLASGRGVAAVTWLGVGRYEVTFARDVSGCAYVATTRNVHSQALQAYTAGGHLDARGVYVETKNQGGGLTDGPFDLAVVCGGRRSEFAVVGYSANLVRASRGATLTSLGAGRYEVRFPRRSALRWGSCAYLATVADPGAALVFNPSGVYTGSGQDTGVVYVETKNPGGGLQPGVPFHLAVVCTGSPDAKIAVVGADGLLRRGSPFTASFTGAPGKYTLVTNRDLTGCATVATRGSVDEAVPFSPTTLEVVPGPAANTVGLDQRELLFFGGDPFAEAFHAVTLCDD